VLRSKAKKIHTMIGHGTSMEGAVTSAHSIRVDGELKGEIRSEGEVIIGVKGVLTGDIHAANLSIEGTVNGNVFLSEHFLLLQQGQLNGDVTAQSIQIEPGAKFNGKSIMNQSQGNNRDLVQKDRTRAAVEPMDVKKNNNAS